MLSKNQLKNLKRLELKKFRQETGLFVAEGPKAVGDLAELTSPQTIITTEDYKGLKDCGCERIIVSEEELRRASFLQHPQQVIGIFRQPIYTPEEREQTIMSARNELVLALDGVQDPGNMGTIIRVADWFGIRTIICSHHSADVWNPKVVQATMGSIARVKILYESLEEVIRRLGDDVPVYGTLLDGENMYEEELSHHGIIIMGNEGNGISESIRQQVNRRLLIPRYSMGNTHAESLNVAIATAVVCSEFRRRLPTAPSQESI
ncbi:MAG: RNA methyltransferase [Prevotella sp.]|nr:RNA methyltransferase [Prevotella sp.]